MDEVTSLTSKQVRIYAPGMVPLIAMRSAAGAETTRNFFGFKEAVLNPSEPEVTFVYGLSVPREGDKVVSITYLEVTQQKISWEVLGDSSAANGLNAKLISLFTELSPEIEHAEPLLFTQESHCSVRLEFSWKDLVSERTAKAIEGMACPRLDLPIASARLASMNLRFKVQYDVSDVRIKEFGIGVLDKALIIEPQQNTPLSDRIFFTSSPLDSESHLNLVRDFERAIMAKQGRGATRRR